MTNSVYRTPGREPEDAPINPPSRGVLFSPLTRGSAWVLLLLAPPLLFNVLLAPAFFQASPELRIVPSLAAIQDAIAILLLAAVPIALHHVTRRVRMAWTGLRRHSKIAYVVALLMAQTLVVAGAEAALLASRGGFELFEPTYRTSFAAPDGRTAYLYAGGFGCHYDVYVAEPYGMTMKRVVSMSRSHCEEPTPHVRWNADGTIDLFDDSGVTLQPQSSGSFFGIGGC